MLSKPKEILAMLKGMLKGKGANPPEATQRNIGIAG